MTDAQEQDLAWVRIESPLSVRELGAFLAVPERLYRINSLLEIHRWEARGPDRVRFEALNLSNGKRIETELRFFPRPDGLRVTYEGLLKTATEFQIESEASGTRWLRITDEYSGTPEAERRTRLDEVDRSLVQWGRDLHGFFQAWKRWSWCAPWRWYRLRVWLGMKPSARRITRWILWITAAELIVFFLVFGILVIERSR